jgi:hypothetical protein
MADNTKQHRSARHDIMVQYDPTADTMAVYWGGDDPEEADPLLVIDNPGEPLEGYNPERFPMTDVQFSAVAVGFYNQLQEERKDRTLMAYQERDPGTDAFHPDREERAREALEAAAENYGTA